MHAIINGILLGSVLFILYVAISPDMKGMMFRPDDAGNLHITPYNIVRLAFTPLIDKNFWLPIMWIANWFAYLFGGILISYTVFSQ